MTRGRLSVVLFVKNEERRIRTALDSVRWADELVIIDDASTDRTAELCREYGARVITCEDSGGAFYLRRNFGFSQCTGDWIMMMDPDEVVTPELRRAIERVLQNEPLPNGYTFWRRNHFWERPLEHGGWKQKTLHLFRRGMGGDRGQQLHSPIEVDGPVGHLNACMDHFPFENVTQIIEKQNFYTSVEARERAAGPWTPGRLGRELVWRPLRAFWKMYVKKRGFADGLPGFILAALFSWVEFVRLAKCWEILERGAAVSPPANSVPRSLEAVS